MFRTRFSVGDGLVILAILSLAALSALSFLPFINRPSGTWLTVQSPAGEERYALSVDRDISVSGNGYTLTVEIRNGRARVATSDCPDKICRNTGWISRAGESIICAPASIRLTVTNKTGGGENADAVIG